jgi:polysaccharide export outer membrane protein
VIQRFLAFFCALFVVALVPQPASAQAAPGPAYRINPGDDLEISVWGDDRLQKMVRVLPDGTFGFPLVGTVLAAGLLPSDVQRIITAGLRPQYKDVVPQVTVVIKSPGGYQFSIIGKVRAPGTFTPGRYVNALEAIGIAGGPSEFANTSKIKIIRKVGQQLQTIPVSLTAALKGDFDQLSAREIPPIQSGDTMVVP